MKKAKLFLSLLLSLCMAIPTSAISIFAAEEVKSYAPGVTIETNRNKEYQGDYNVTFVYEDSDENIESVALTGNFQWYKWDDEKVAGFADSGNCTGAVAYSAYEYEKGMFNTGYNASGYPMDPYTLEETSEGHYQITLPLPGNLYAYDYAITYTDGTTKTVHDPANKAPGNAANGHDAGHSLVLVGAANKTTAGQESIYESSKKGTYSYIPYTDIKGNTQYLGVYLPYGYDETKTYQTLYVSHGGGGNEAEWMTIGALPNIMDNLMASKALVPCVVVTMCNSAYSDDPVYGDGTGTGRNWYFDTIAENFEKCIFPTIEAKYSVSKEAADRALCGLSMGSLTTSAMVQHHVDLFGIYGCFSGASVTELDDVEGAKNATIYLTAGCVDMAYSDGKKGARSTLGFKQLLDDNGVDYGFDVQGGAHDWGVWRAALTTFARDYLWEVVPETAEPTEAKPGVTVNGNDVTFVYESNTDKQIASVTVGGNFQFYKWEDPAIKDFINKGSAPGAVVYGPEDYDKDTMFNTNYGLNSDSVAIPLAKTGENRYETTITLPGSEYAYKYTVTYIDGTSVTMQDPANPSPKNPANGHDSGNSLVWVGNSQNCIEGQEYIYARNDQNGSFEYIPYTAVDGTTQYLGVYTPYGYDPEGNYPVVYVSHGGGGNEAEWGFIGSATNIFDNLIASKAVVPCLYVTMDNTYFGWKYDVIAENFEKHIIPTIEAKYAVSTEREDRALCGLSMGSMTTTTMMQTYTHLFGAYGCFSGANVPAEVTDIKLLKDSVIYLSAGNVDMALVGAPGTSQDNKTVAMAEKLDDLGVEYGYDLKGGAHDWGVWRACLSTFLRDYLWDVQPETAEPTTCKPGVTVNGNDVTFVYVNDSDKTIASITLGGNFQFYKWDDPAVKEFEKTGSAPGAVVYGPEDYDKDTMFNTNYGLNGDSLAIPLAKTGENRYETTITLPGTEYAYKYTITYTDGTSVTIQDPANPSPKNPANGHDSGNSLVWVGSADNCIKGQEYIYARNDKNGSFEYIPYKAVDGTTQYLGIYTPYGYDKTKEYKTVYISHGGGGNEAEWPFIGSATNIFDNLIAAGETEPAVYVTMDNTYFGWDYDKIAENFSKHIIPLVEANYAVSTKVEDRALCGLSMGALTTGTIMFSYTDMFGAYGCFSGCADPLLCKDIDLLKTKTIYLTGGNVDMAIQAAPDAEDSAFNRGKTVRTHEYLESIGVEHTYDLKGGAHDWGVWRESLTTFLKDVLWNTNQPTTPDNGGTTGGTTTGGTTPSVGIYNNVAYAAIATIALAGAAYVALKKKED